jgi:hypothetical protein
MSGLGKKERKQLKLAKGLAAAAKHERKQRIEHNMRSTPEISTVDNYMNDKGNERIEYLKPLHRKGKTNPTRIPAAYSDYGMSARVLDIAPHIKGPSRKRFRKE